MSTLNEYQLGICRFEAQNYPKLPYFKIKTPKIYPTDFAYHALLCLHYIIVTNISEAYAQKLLICKGMYYTDTEKEWRKSILLAEPPAPRLRLLCSNLSAWSLRLLIPGGWSYQKRLRQKGIHHLSRFQILCNQVTHLIVLGPHWP